MNEQFKKLLLEAQALARAEVKSSPEFAKYAPSYAIPGTEIHVGLGLSYQKFAELIVEDTLKQVNNAMELTWPEMETKIKQHFGVAE